MWMIQKDSLAEIFRDNVRHAMHTRGWKQKDLADRMGVSVAQVSHYIRGYRDPGLVTIDKIAQALGVPPDTLLRKKI